MLFAGYLVSQDKMSLAAAILAGTLGNVVGSWIAWGVGYVGGRPFIALEFVDGDTLADA
jgi:membrane protein DedA with SNARE-associated domain